MSGNGNDRYPTQSRQFLYLGGEVADGFARLYVASEHVFFDADGFNQLLADAFGARVHHRTGRQDGIFRYHFFREQVGESVGGE